MSEKRRKALSKSGSQFAGVNVGDMDTSMMFGDLNSFGAFPFPTVPTVYQKPRPQIFYITRNWFERSSFIKMITGMKLAMYNFGFTVVAKDKKDRKAIDKWKDEDEGFGATIRQFARDAWQEWLIQDNAIAVWRKDGIPCMYPCEHASYMDDFGIEQLAISHSLTAEAVEAMPGLSSAERNALKSNTEMKLVKQGAAYQSKLFYFEVVKRARVGAGLAWPQLRTLFNTVGSWESMELADWQLADAIRTVYEMHLVGHEIKSGPHAGSNAHFLKKKRADTITKMIGNNKKLLARVLKLVNNFDHKIEYPRPDPKHFGKDRYDGMLQRFMFWGAPLAQLALLGTGSINPFMMTLLKAQVTQERDYIGPFIKTVLTRCLKPPAPIEIEYGDDVFWDQRLLLEILKAGLTSGPLSGRTFLEKVGFQPEAERAHKDEEHKLPPHQILPPFDPNHGNRPGMGEAAGRKPGGRDNRQRKSK